jgi:ferredoxin-NADP reductase/DMSO/TMAO reductase YedYZ heme-binding membrane subunit
MKRHRDLRFTKLLVVINALVPGAILAWDAAHGQIGVNGVNYALHTTGLLSLIFLLLTLLVTPLRKLTGWNAIISYRRTLGLFAFGYASVHFLIFFGLDRALSVSSTLHEILARRYLLIGTVGLLSMIPLAITSTSGMVTRIGARRWKALHRLVYVSAIAGALHYYLLVKSDTRQPLAFAAVLALLLGFRVVRYRLDRGRLPARGGLPGRSAATGRVGGGSVANGAPHASAAARNPRFWSGELRVAGVFEETPDVRTFRLMPPDGGELPFVHQPGQYLNLALMIDGKRVKRSYTIASSPTRGHFCELTVKRTASGFGSWHLHDHIHVGSTLAVSAPAGRFVFTGAEADRVVLIAGGVGITPLMAIVRYLTDRCWPGQIYLLFAARTEGDLIFAEELSYLEKRFRNLHVCRTFSRPAASAGPDGKGTRGAISRALLERFVPDVAKGPVYLCGPDGMMTATRALLLELGLPEAQLKTEAFVSAQAGGTDQPEPNAPSRVSAVLEASADADLTRAPTATGGEGARVRFARSGLELEPPAGKTILETAEDAGVSIPFECRAGICGQCKTRLVSGRVTMDSEDALSATEKARGLILACQARPSGDVAVDA